MNSAITLRAFKQCKVIAWNGFCKKYKSFISNASTALATQVINSTHTFIQVPDNQVFKPLKYICFGFEGQHAKLSMKQKSLLKYNPVELTTPLVSIQTQNVEDTQKREDTKKSNQWIVAMSLVLVGFVICGLSIYYSFWWSMVVGVPLIFTPIFLWCGCTINAKSICGCLKILGNILPKS